MYIIQFSALLQTPISAGVTRATRYPFVTLRCRTSSAVARLSFAGSRRPSRSRNFKLSIRPVCLSAGVAVENKIRSTRQWSLEQVTERRVGRRRTDAGRMVQ